MKILWTKANKLLPVHSGGDIRSYHIARQLAATHDLTFFSYYDGQPDIQYERKLNAEFPGSVSVCTGKNGSVPARAIDYVLRLSNRAPYAVSRFECREVQQKLNTWFNQRTFDVVVCDFLDAAVNFPECLSTPSVLFQHNVESEIWRRHAQTETNTATRLMYALEFRKMLAYERATVGKFHHVIAVSEHDKQIMSSWVEPSRITVVPTGVDLRQYRPDPTVRPHDALVVFTGAMDWEPNIDAVEYFCAEIWPSVLAAVPEARFRIVGRNPDPRVQRLASASIEVTGRVDSVLQHLKEATVVVVPLRIGGGTRLKIYEAMASGKAVISTSVGAEGLDVHDGRDIMLADEVQTFSAAVAGLLRNSDVRKRIGDAAVESTSQLGWDKIGAQFGDLLKQIETAHAERHSSSVDSSLVQRKQATWPG